MRKLIAAIAMAAVVAAAATGAASSGARGKGDSTCPQGKLCVWTGANYTGDRLLIGTRKLSDRLYDDGFNDVVTSLKLRKSGTAILYTDVGGAGPFRCFGFNGEDRKVPDLGDLAWQFDDTASSSRIRKGTHPQECTKP